MPHVVDSCLRAAFDSGLTPGFQRYVAVLRIRFRNRFRKNRVRTAVP